MFTIKNYVVAETMEQAYELNQKRNNVILGGIGWLKMGSRNIQTAIDLSKLGLDKIEEDEDSFKIGCMCTLRDMETNKNFVDSFIMQYSRTMFYLIKTITVKVEIQNLFWWFNLLIR